jgi:signal transduction histidine kinase
MANNMQKKLQTDDSNKSFFREIQIEFLLHELKDPIAIIETGARTLLEKKEKYGALTPRQEKTLDRILRNTKKTREMLHDLLEVGRSEAGSVVCCPFQPAKATLDVLMEALETKANGIFEQVKLSSRENDMLKALGDHGILLDISPQLTFTEMLQDEIKFRQIVANLIKNALHYRRERIVIRLERDNDTLLFEVADDGPGIAPEHHQLIFQRYAQVDSCATLSRQSHGLGLAGALILARCLGGNIDLMSEKDQGATFRLTIPITMADSPENK